MPTQHERLFHGIGAGDDLDVVEDVAGARIGGLICWENRMPLARYAVYRGGPQIWVAPTADDSDGWLASMRHIAIESGAFVVSVPQFIPSSAFPDDFPVPVPADKEVFGRGGAALIEPTSGAVIAGPLYDEEGIVAADCDLRRSLHAKRWFDAVGHYSRADVFWLRWPRWGKHGMSSPYHDGSRRLQDRFDTRRLADRIGDRFLSRPVIDPDDRAFIERMDMFFLATADAEGRPQCSYKGGDPGFVRVLDERTVAFPSYDGNGMYLSRGTCSRTHTWGCCSSICLRPTSRLRLNGIASVDEHDQLLGEFPEAQLVIRVVQPRCFRTVPDTSTGWLSSNDLDSSRTQVETPTPDWKRCDWARDVLPKGDPAHRVGGDPA